MVKGEICQIEYIFGSLLAFENQFNIFLLNFYNIRKEYPTGKRILIM